MTYRNKYLMNFMIQFVFKSVSRNIFSRQVH